MNVIPRVHLEVAQWVRQQVRAHCTRLELRKRVGDAEAHVSAWPLSAGVNAYCIAEEILAAASDAASKPGGATLYAILSFHDGRVVHRDHKVFRIDAVTSDAPTVRFSRVSESGVVEQLTRDLNLFEGLAFHARLDDSSEPPVAGAAIARPPRRPAARALTPRRRKASALPRPRRT